MKRPNLTVMTGVQVEKVLLEDKKAVGVRIIKGGIKNDIKCRGEVVLSAGPVGSPHILQLSGIGNADVLMKAGIDVKHELPGVGENLQDHLEVYVQHACTQPVSMQPALRWWINLGSVFSGFSFERALQPPIILKQEALREAMIRWLTPT